MSNDNNKKENKEDSRLKKIFRKFSRKVETKNGFKIFGVSGAISGLPLFLIDPTGISYATFIAATTGIGGALGYATDSSNLSIVTDKTSGKKDFAFLDMGGFTIKGNKKDLKQIRATQWLIQNYCLKYTITPILPDDLQYKISKHIEDIQPALDRVEIFKSGKLLDKMQFNRSYRDPETGDDVLQLIFSRPVDGDFYNTYDFFTGKEEEKKLQGSKNKVDEFNEMSRKVKALEAELKIVKNPKLHKLNKPNVPKKGLG